jgi:hypothetical protein
MAGFGALLPMAARDTASFILIEPAFLDVGVVFRLFVLDPIEVGQYFLRCKQSF